MQTIGRKKLQLVGVTAMLASKYEEMYSPETSDFVYITENAFTKAHIREMEQLILQSLNFELGWPLPLHFLRRASKAGNVGYSMTCMFSYTFLYGCHYSNHPINSNCNYLLGGIANHIGYQKVSNTSGCLFRLLRSTLAKYLMGLTLLDYDIVHYHPSEIAAA